MLNLFSFALPPHNTMSLYNFGASQSAECNSASDDTPLSTDCWLTTAVGDNTIAVLDDLDSHSAGEFANLLRILYQNPAAAFDDTTSPIMTSSLGLSSSGLWPSHLINSRQEFPRSSYVSVSPTVEVQQDNPLNAGAGLNSNSKIKRDNLQNGRADKNSLKLIDRRVREKSPSTSAEQSRKKRQSSSLKPMGSNTKGNPAKHQKYRDGLNEALKELARIMAPSVKGFRNHSSDKTPNTKVEIVNQAARLIRDQDEEIAKLKSDLERAQLQPFEIWSQEDGRKARSAKSRQAQKKSLS